MKRFHVGRSLQEMLFSERFMSQSLAYFGLNALTRVMMAGLLGHTLLLGVKAVKWIVLAMTSMAISRSTRLTSKGQGIMAGLAAFVLAALK